MCTPIRRKLGVCFLHCVLAVVVVVAYLVTLLALLLVSRVVVVVVVVSVWIDCLCCKCALIELPSHDVVWKKTHLQHQSTRI